MSNDRDLLTLAACARELSALGDEISRQGLSKYCDAHGLKQKTPNGTRVSLAAVKAHRAANYQREVMSGVAVPPPAALPAPADAPALALVDAPKDPPAAGPEEDGGSVVDLSPARRLKELQVERQEIENAKARDEVVLADEVTAGTADVIVMMRQAMFQAIPDAAQALAAELSLGSDDERIIRAKMKAVARDVLKSFVASAAQANADLSRDTPNATRQRIGKLTVLAAVLRQRPDRHIAILKDRAG